MSMGMLHEFSVSGYIKPGETLLTTYEIWYVDGNSYDCVGSGVELEVDIG